MTGRRGLSRRRYLQGIGAVAAAAVVGEQITGAPAHAAPAARGRLRFGFQTPPQHVAYRDLEDVWVEADGLGLDSAFVFDHFIPIFSDPSGPCFEGWTLLAALAARTKVMRVGVLVTGNTYRHPAVLAKMCDAVIANDLAAGRALHDQLLEINKAVFFDTNPIPMKYMMMKLGLLAKNEHRLPMLPATPDLAAKLDGVLERAGLTSETTRRRSAAR